MNAENKEENEDGLFSSSSPPPRLRPWRPLAVIRAAARSCSESRKFPDDGKAAVDDKEDDGDVDKVDDANDDDDDDAADGNGSAGGSDCRAAV